MSLLFAGIAALALVELVVNLVFRPQSGPFALGAAFEPHVLVIGAVAGAVAMLLTLSDRSPAANRIRILGIVVIVLALVRVGGEWWSPDDGPNPIIQTAGTTRVSVMSWNLEVGSKAPAQALAGILHPPGRGMPDVVTLQFDGWDTTVNLIEQLHDLQDKVGVKPDDKKGKEGTGLLAKIAEIKGQLSAIMAVEGLPGLRHNNLVFSDCWVDGRSSTSIKDLKIELAQEGLLKTDADFELWEKCVKAATKTGDGYMRRMLTDLNKPKFGWED